MIRRTFLLPLLAVLSLSGSMPAQSAQASAVPARGLDPWQREFLSAFGSLPALPAAENAAAPRIAGVSAPEWREFGPPVARAAAAGVYLFGTHQVLLFGGSDGANRNDVWVLGLSDTAFARFNTYGVPPSPRVGHSMVLDSLRKRVLVFGGWDGEYRDDLWQLSLTDSVWTQLAATGPAARAAHSAVYDPAGDRMIVHGGWGGTSLGDVWSLSLGGGAWTQLQPTGTAPAARYGHSAVWDDSLSRMLVFGGESREGESFEYRNDTWELSFAGAPAWNVWNTSGTPPLARYAHSAVLDPRNDKMIVFGGWTGVYANDTHELSLLDGRWRSPGQTTNLPATRANHTAVYDTLARRMLVVWGWGDGAPRNYQHAMTALTGDWTQLSSARRAPSPRFASTLVYDAPRERMVLYGGSNEDAHLGDVWWWPLAGSGWQLQATSGTLPEARSDHAAVYDSVRQRMIVVGGRSHSYGQVQIIRHGDVWTLPLAGLPTWASVPVRTIPERRALFSVVFDESRRRAILFGGINNEGGPVNDTWVLDYGDSMWTRITPLGVLPPGRGEHTAIYDAAGDRMLVFGGRDPGVMNDLWELSFAGAPRWTQLSPVNTPPAARYGHTLTLDAAHSRAILIGGATAFEELDDVWELTLAGVLQWNRLSPAGAAPAARRYHTSVLEAGRNRIVVFGGSIAGDLGSHAVNDVWQLSLGVPAWQQIMPEDVARPDHLQPSARQQHLAVYDPIPGRMLVFGGAPVDTIVSGSDSSTVEGAVWSLDLASDQWSLVAGAGAGPRELYGNAGFFDAGTRRMLLFGPPDLLDPITLSSFSVRLPPTWSSAAYPGHTLPARFGHSLVFDPIDERLIVFGGDTEDSSGSEVWTLDMQDPTWSQLVVVGTPPAMRQGHAAILDDVRHRMLVFGGFDGSSDLDDVWSLSLGTEPTWSLVADGGGPSARRNHSASYDRERDRLIVFGGWDGALRNDVWELSLASGAWSQVQPTAPLSVVRQSHAAIYDPPRDRLMVFGGYSTSQISGPRNDLWSLTWPAEAATASASVIALDSEPGAVRVTWQIDPSASPVARVYRTTGSDAWTALATVRGEAGRVAFADPDPPADGRVGYRLGLLREGGEDLAGEVWTDAPAERPGALPIVFPSPSRGAFSVSFTLPDARPARLEVFDIGGRRLFERNLEALGAGTHRLAIGEHARLRAGVYLVRLTHASTTRAVRAVVLE